MARKLFPCILLLCAINVCGQKTAYEEGKLSPATAHFLSTYHRTAEDTATHRTMRKYFAVKRQTATDDDRIDAFLHIKEGCRVETLADSFDLRIQSFFPASGLVTASIPVKRLEALAMHPHVRQVEMGTPASLTMHRARPLGRVDEVHEGIGLPAAFTGKDVVVGIIDGGFQYNHAAFYSADRTDYRVKRVWEQGEEQNVQYDTEETIIAREYDSYARTQQETHATHVTGIAAGADTTLPYHGIATGAELVLVSYGGSTTDIANAIQYIYDYAESVGKPAVVNMSLGVHTGPHDGTSTFDRACDEMAGPGRLLVGAAGNEGDTPLHIGKTFTATDDTLKTFIDFTSNVQYSIVDLWSDPGRSFHIELLACDLTTGQETPITDTPLPADAQTSKSYSLQSVTGSSYDWCDLSTRRDSQNNKANAYLTLYLARPLPASMAIGFRITATEGTVHGWADGQYSVLSSREMPGWTSGDTRCTAGEIGGTGKSIISVGAYTSAETFTNTAGQTGSLGEDSAHIATFSSRGPTPDGRMKPDITAPGTVLVSAFTDKTYSFFSPYRSYVVSRTDDAYYGAMQGTSMAAPYVTGILATWLEAKPDLTPDEVRDVLAHTARTDDYTGSARDYTWGYGKINAWTGLQRVLALQTFPEKQEIYGEISISQDLTARRLYIEVYNTRVRQLTLSLYTPGGQLAASRSIAITDHLQPAELSLAALSPGVYILHAAGENLHSQSHKIIVR